MIAYDWPSAKYSSARDSYLHAMCQEGWANESTGDVASPIGYVWRVSNSIVELPEILDAFGAAPLNDDSDVTPILGYFLVTENDQGFVYVDRYATEFLLLNAYAALERAYCEWDSQGEYGEPEILAPSDEITVTGI